MDPSLKNASPEGKAQAAHLRDYRFLKSDRVQVSEHPMPQYAPYMLSTKLTQVTRRCKLRCEYCVYAGNYKNRHHRQKDGHNN